MPTAPFVRRQDVSAAMQQIHRRGDTAVLRALERQEPLLLEHLLEMQTALHHQLLDAGVRQTDALRFTRRSRRLSLTCLLALQRACRRRR